MTEKASKARSVKSPAAKRSTKADTAKTGPAADFWSKRIRSRAFKESLESALAREIRSLGRVRVREVVDAKAVRRALSERQGPRFVPDALADIWLAVNDAVNERLWDGRSCVRDILDDKLMDDVEALIDAEPVPPDDMESFVSNLVNQPFMEALFTDIVYTSILAFQRKVNPLGALAMGMVENQVKGFIRMMMPMLQRQAVSFATSRGNQAILTEFGRALIRQLLDEPLPSYLSMVSREQRSRWEALVRDAVRSEKLDHTLRDLTLHGWDALYATIADRRIGDVLRLDEHADTLAAHVARAAVAALSRPAILGLIADEAERAK